eukprot:CAMPEP_0170287708 /NCGR_PEP_ID=MMETSP0116_2-20130129/43911_1 /TAXON_ID=400756 /ORGANISM="Durinskia baltica, Strain CSIRO CS-38" /LENGTH=142 /DNA_ID=CAMNT_0010539125 /DNA_START=69 /DNA_END=497 /DNA_ORIENTATION=-
MGCFSSKAAAATAVTPAATLSQDRGMLAGQGAKEAERGGPIHNVANQVTAEIERRKEDAVVAIDVQVDSAKDKVDAGGDAAKQLINGAGDAAKGAIEGAKGAAENAVIGAADAAEHGAEAVHDAIVEVEERLSKMPWCGCAC